jgi:TolB-like protein/tetratricopeptide (TPR) repeat protein
MAEPLERLQKALADRYAVERELGRGGMASVYLAQERHPQRHVAIKVLDPAVAATLGRERFLREVDLASKLAHPHILPIYAAAEADGLLYYVMPYVEGESLRDRLTREKQLPLDDALRISREVADALSYAHSRGVVHRDIKPENILLESGHAVVADFGIARAIDQAGGPSLTQTGVALGTPAYMSPEQAAGSKDLDGRSDLYSLGCVLYEMLAGEPPFTGPTADSVVYQHLAVEPPSVTRLRPAVPASVAAALQRALAKTPADRFNPVAQFAEALGSRASLTGQSEAAATPSAVPAAAPGALRRTWRRSWRAAAWSGLAVVVLLAGALVLRHRPSPGRAAPRHPRTAIAVLPFENLSARGPYSYFAGGLHDELLTQLAKVAALTVIGRTSVGAYAGTTKRLSEIGDELGVGSIVEGSVQIAGNRLRVIVQLIDPVTEAHIWAETYDRTLDDAFAVQSDIARRIVAGVGARLTNAEAGAIATAPTRQALAYQLYLQGLEYFRRATYRFASLEAAQQLWEQALAYDSTFALAHAGLSEVHGLISFYRYDVSPRRLSRQRAEAETALRLAPDLAAAHAAMGLVYYWGRGEYRRALGEFNLALRSAPSDADVWGWIGYVQRRLGNWDSVLVAFANASRLDPRDPNLFFDLGGQTYQFLRRYDDAVRTYRQALELAPDEMTLRAVIGLTYMERTGQPDSVWAVWPSLGPDLRASSEALRFLLRARQPDSLLAWLAGAGRTIVADQDAYRPAALYAAWAYLLRGDTVAAHAAFDSARVVLDSAVRALPDDWRIHAARGQALAGLGRRAEALREARWLAESFIYRSDRLFGPDVAEERAQILARAGETAAALQEIERLLAGPSWLSVPLLRLDPRWDPIRSDPRFQALLVKYASTGAP